MAARDTHTRMYERRLFVGAPRTRLVSRSVDVSGFGDRRVVDFERKIQIFREVRSFVTISSKVSCRVWNRSSTYHSDADPLSHVPCLVDFLADMREEIEGGSLVAEMHASVVDEAYDVIESYLVPDGTLLYAAVPADWIDVDTDRRVWQNVLLEDVVWSSGREDEDNVVTWSRFVRAIGQDMEEVPHETLARMAVMGTLHGAWNVVETV